MAAEITRAQRMAPAFWRAWTTLLPTGCAGAWWRGSDAGIPNRFGRGYVVHGSKTSPSNHVASRHFPVVVVGAGPTGLTLSILLSKLGVHHAILEKAHRLTDQPQAHFINHRSMEIFRHMDGLADEIRARSPPLTQWRNFVYCSSMLGQVFGTVDHFPGQGTALLPQVSPEPVTHLSQNRLLPLLLQRAERYSHTAKVSFGSEVVGIDETASQVRLTVESSSPRSHAEATTVTCDYLVAADGANSRVRESMQIAMNGDPALQHLINIHFFSKELASRLANRPAMLYFCFNPSVIAVIVAHDLQAGEFVAQVPFFPPLQSASSFTQSVAASLVREAAGADVALQERRAFLAGDAAHRFPPAGGFGMNTGIQDAHNLAWKIACCHFGLAPHELLETYDAERRPVAMANTELSIQNYNDALQVPRAIGLDPAVANKVAGVMSHFQALLPKGLPEAAFESCLSLGRTSSSTSIPLVSSWSLAAMERVLREGKTLRLQFPAEDLGFRYDLGGHCNSNASTCSPGRDRRQEPAYEPCTAPGSRMPHCEVDLLPPDMEYRRCTSDWFLHDKLQEYSASRKQEGPSSRLSTLDAVAACGARPLLFVSSGWLAREWLKSAVLLHKEGYNLQVLQVLDDPLGSRIPFHACSAVVVDASGSWADNRGVSANGALLIRPDGHVAWRWSVPDKDITHSLRIQVARMFRRRTVG